jgi:hypothetical protein
MILDEWLTRLVAVPPGRNPLANGIAIGMRIALFILVRTDERKQPPGQIAIRQDRKRF